MPDQTYTSDDLVSAFVAGAKWWEYKKIGATMWQSDQRLAEEEAISRYQKHEHDNE